MPVMNANAVIPVDSSLVAEKEPAELDAFQANTLQKKKSSLGAAKVPLWRWSYAHLETGE